MTCPKAELQQVHRHMTEKDNAIISLEQCLEMQSFNNSFLPIKTSMRQSLVLGTEITTGDIASI
eukprot:4481328-Karenia_brevis.AAC.1